MTSYYPVILSIEPKDPFSIDIDKLQLPDHIVLSKAPSYCLSSTLESIERTDSGWILVSCLKLIDQSQSILTQVRLSTTIGAHSILTFPASSDTDAPTSSLLVIQVEDTSTITPEDLFEFEGASLFTVAEITRTCDMTLLPQCPHCRALIDHTLLPSLPLAPITRLPDTERTCTLAPKPDACRCGRRDPVQCLVCGVVGCSREGCGEAQRHWEATGHRWAAHVASGVSVPVWDYQLDRWVDAIPGEGSDPCEEVCKKESALNQAIDAGAKSKRNQLADEYDELLLALLQTQQRDYGPSLESCRVELERVRRSVAEEEAAIQHLRAELSTARADKSDLSELVRDLKATLLAREAGSRGGRVVVRPVKRGRKKGRRR
eukprot:gnl/Dysnectes_brevis/3812_a4908_429.p1 GENE.gnl/Dysnectes_brevis/3812_a4908_429~~gnl/Dysnectes_brevis/3812_a4908_429.p1  ORF type:complete len:375 (-),score=84.81 gnl/Dysnectes_brevis/3812_a4908_429:216-1340(-)